MKKKPKTKKRNPQDVTFRNINALKKRVAKLEEEIELLLELAQDVGLYLADGLALTLEGYKREKKRGKK